MVAQARTEGSYEYMRSLPVPRILHLLADLTVWLVIVLPGVAFAILLGAWRFSLDLQVSPLIIPALALTTLTAASIGYAIASVLPPMAANMMSQVLVVFVLMFSPLNFPPDRLPSWLTGIHAVLPVQAMGEVLRGTLAPASFPLPAGAFLLLGAWALGSFGVAWRVMERRG
jgi:ABC-2 type transport system permease protein